MRHRRWIAAGVFDPTAPGLKERSMFGIFDTVNPHLGLIKVPKRVVVPGSRLESLKSKEIKESKRIRE